MRKITVALVAIMLTVAILCLSACGLVGAFLQGLGEAFGGGDTDEGGAGGTGGNGGSGGHTHEFASYFTYSVCSVDGCKVVGRNASENTYANDFNYTLTGAKIKEINAVYDEMTTYLAGSDNYDYFEQLYDQYVEWLDYVGHQYQVSSILNDVEYNSTTVSNYRTASQLYNEMLEKYYGLYKLIYDNFGFRAKFYEGWSDDEIDEALAYAARYAGSADNNNAVDEILSDYEEYMDGINWYIQTTAQLNKLGEIYGELVAANNNVAKSMGYENYLDYAYANEYNRDYAPSDVANSMRQYVKEYVAPIFINVGMTRHALVGHSAPSFNTAADRNFYYGLMTDSLFLPTSDKNFGRVKTVIDYVADYFKAMQTSAAVAGGEKFDFDSAVEDLFKCGNYFTGEYEGAYTWWIDAIEKPILYFGPDYDTAFTFVHEFGHYYNNVYNGSMHLSYDHDETHSQGNEMMFLAWLANNKPSGVTKGFDVVEVEQLFDMLANIVIATAVDEFEQAAYTGYYNGQPIGSYADLFVKVLGSYRGTYNGVERSATSFLNTSYWGYVAFNSSAYYISYAMSALPSLELYALAMSGNNGFESAKESYVKLFTFSNSAQFATTDDSGRKHLTANATYENILNYCGLQGPFQMGLYTTLATYFDSRTDLK